ncbi:UDP-N-acetylmuramoyl-L-alanyl-D-glutamate--2,6-diaminopimelate ligase [Kitasatospora kifunensis]|uniref:UDP-N-acetylmuramyl-tripeptide synthetase n=1 Tax=Kitasatospora kifunensis TaxID=58351 RepID=A0A7W7R9A0_KITKI|nr:UDP-N-acetylmuramoyl-L-alanyl-D-glutamate--2,6-diaminopimelate ligase [Kitasatospora kifunensis]MBB4927176.1 UDP-N-acetylmuramoyl-L-alanyl-D-glutamate--2,6-diaminopimelate ligase [Kitasatospora kifunensis]
MTGYRRAPGPRPTPPGPLSPDQAGRPTADAAPRAGVLLSQLATTWPGAELRGDAAVVDCTHDSRQVRPGWLFCALAGARTDGHHHAAAAVRAGARALLVQRFLELDVPQLRVPNVRWAIGPIAAALHGCPADRLSLAGVTGTNGKTTTSYLLHAAFVAAGWRAGQLGTVETRIGEHRWASALTTLEAPDLQRVFARMRAERVKAAAMEVSSHALDQHRVAGVAFDVGVFTNLAAEHLDYHGTMEQYYYTKSLLFAPGRCRQAVVCVDDEWGRRLAAQAQVPVLTFGHSACAEARITETRCDRSGTLIRLDCADGLVELTAPVLGSCNSTNVAAAYLTARAMRVPAGPAAAGIAGCAPIPGRSELIDAGQPFLVLVDYAHTPGALEGQLATCRDLAARGGRVHLVIGCRGDRDRYKRPETGRVAASADTAILTSDSPGDEDPRAIVEQMLVGVLDRPDGQVVLEPDRAAAIRLAITRARPGDVVLIVGRGHETTQQVAGRELPFDDRRHARAALAACGWATGGRAPGVRRRRAPRRGHGVTTGELTHATVEEAPVGFAAPVDEVSPRSVPPP